MSLYKEIEKLKYDKRLSEWHVSRGKMTKEELEKHLASLPDSGDNVETLRLAEDERGGNGSLNGHGHQ